MTNKNCEICNSIFKSEYQYTRHKNKRLHPEKMALNMYDPYIRKHCKYTEQKIKK